MRFTTRHITKFFTASALVVLTACALSRRDRESAIAERLAAISSADQADRAPEIWPAQWEAVSKRDSVRRGQILELLKSQPTMSSNDWYHAALVLQHGSDSASFRQAHDWAQRAVQLDSTNTQARWLIAAAWDRLQMSVGKPQWYGTQSMMIAGRWQLYRLDSTKVTDADRRKLGVASLDSLRAAVDRLNSKKP